VTTEIHKPAAVMRSLVLVFNDLVIMGRESSTSPTSQDMIQKMFWLVEKYCKEEQLNIKFHNCIKIWFQRERPW